MIKKNKQEFTNSQLSVIGVYLLGGAINSIDMEDIGIKLFEMTPGRFSLHKYPEHIDIHSIRVALSNAERLEPHHLSGSIKNGYMLTAPGLAWVNSLNLEEELPEFHDKSRRGSITELFELERERLRQTSAYLLYSENQIESLTRKDFFDFLRINEYFPAKKILEKIQFVENSIESDGDLRKLWQELKTRFIEEVIQNDIG